MNYREKLRDPRWQKKRLEALEYAGWQCSSCSADDITLNVHHKIYRKGWEPWDYDKDELETLCEKCHKKLHECESAVKELVSQVDSNTISGLLAGFCSSDSFSDKNLIEQVSNHVMPQDMALGFLAGILSHVSLKHYY